MSRWIAVAVLCCLSLGALAACGDGAGESDATPTPRVTLEPTEGATATPTRTSGGVEGPAAPPLEGDGRLVFISDHTGNNEVWAIDPDGSGLLQLTESPEQETSAYWSPDGGTIGFTRFAEDGTVTFFEMDADGGNVRESDEATLQAWVDRLVVSRDGSVRIQSTKVVDAAGETLLTLDFPEDAVGDAMVLSPDGRRITLGLARDIFAGLPQAEIDRIRAENDRLAMLELAENEYNIAVIDVATGATQDVTLGLGRDWLPVWGPDSTRIAYLGRVQVNEPAGIYMVDLNGENPAEIFPAPDCDECVGVSRVQWSR